jgi:hypothetical protein
MNETSPASQPEEPQWSSCRNETIEEGQTLTVTGFFSGGRRDSEKSILAEYGAFVPSEDEDAVESKLKRIIRLRNQSPPSGPKS